MWYRGKEDGASLLLQQRLLVLLLGISGTFEHHSVCNVAASAGLESRFFRLIVLVFIHHKLVIRIFSLLLSIILAHGDCRVFTIHHEYVALDCLSAGLQDDILKLSVGEFHLFEYFRSHKLYLVNLRDTVVEKHLDCLLGHPTKGQMPEKNRFLADRLLWFLCLLLLSWLNFAIIGCWLLQLRSVLLLHHLVLNLEYINYLLKSINCLNKMKMNFS